MNSYRRYFDDRVERVKTGRTKVVKLLLDWQIAQQSDIYNQENDWVRTKLGTSCRRGNLSYNIVLSSYVFIVGAILTALLNTPVFADATSEQAKAHQFYARGDLRGAISTLEKAIKTYPQDPQLHFMLANAHFREKQWRDAIDHYKTAGLLRPRHPDTHLGLGHAYYQAGNITKAVASWRTAFHQSRGDVLPSLALAVGLNAHNKISEARRYVNEAHDIDPNLLERLSIDVRWDQNMIGQIRSLMYQSNRGMPKVTHGGTQDGL